MSDPWARPSDDSGAPPARRIEHSVDVELDGGPGDPGDGDQRTEPNWRKVIAIASVLGVALGVMITIVVSTQDDDSEEADEVPTSITDITTPPTLPPIATTAPTVADSSDTGDDGAPGLPDGTVSSLLDFPDADLPNEELDQFVLDAGTVDDAAADRVTIDIGGEAGPRLTIEHDATNNRYLTTNGELATAQQILVDLGSDEVFVRDGIDDPSWQQVQDRMPAGTLAEQLRMLLHSPVRSEVLQVATTIDAQSAVVLDDGTVARRYEIELPGSALPEYGIHPDDLLVQAFVDGDGRLALVQAVIDVGRPQLVVYRFDRGAQVTIEAPTVTG